MSRRTVAQMDADTLRAGARVLRAYSGPPATINVLETIADSIEAGRRRRVKTSTTITRLVDGLEANRPELEATLEGQIGGEQ